MAISPYKTWNAGDVLTASDLNASFSQITSNGQDIPFPRTKVAAMAGFALQLDAGSTSWIIGTSANVVDVAVASTIASRVDGSAADNVFQLRNRAGSAVQTLDLTGTETAFTLKNKAASATIATIDTTGIRSFGGLWVPTIDVRSGATITAPADANENTLLTYSYGATGDPAALGANGMLFFQFSLTVSNNANGKNFRVRISGVAGTVLFNQSLANSAAWTIFGWLRNRNATNVQQLDVYYMNNSTLAPALAATAAVDTTVAGTILFTMQKGSAGDTVTTTGHLIQGYRNAA